MKSTVDQIRQRFDQDVERFSKLETGQSAVMDGALMMELVAQSAAAANPQARSVLDIGCGAGNYTLKLLQLLPDLDITLVDLSRPMLERAIQRIQPQTRGRIVVHQGDIREVEIGLDQYDLILAGMVLHHLRSAAEWYGVFSKLFAALKPGGSVWIADMVEHSDKSIRALMWQRYGDYLTGIKGETYREHVFAYIEQEDTPRSLLYQLDLLRACGFCEVELLHKNGPFAAFGAMKTNLNCSEEISTQVDRARGDHEETT